MGKHERKLCVAELVIETTRRCPIACEHCCRGDAQDMDFDVRHLDRFLRGCETVGTLTLSGGEPSLVVPIMRKCFASCHKHDVGPSAFFVATNGLNEKNQLAMAQLLLKEYARMDEKEMCAVALSVDEYHDWQCADHRSEIVRGLSFYSEVKQTTYEYANTVPQGRAARNAIADPERMTYEPNRFSPEDVSDGLIYVDYVYLSANGYAYPCCNLSYETMDARKLVPIEDLPAVMNQMANGHDPGHVFF